MHPLIGLALAILASIVGTVALIWYLASPKLDPSRLRRENKGRRRSDQAS